MTRFISCAVIVALCAVPAALLGQDAPAASDSARAVGAARDWLELLDRKQGRAALDSAAPLLRSIVGSPAKWDEFLQSARVGFPDSTTRVLSSVERDPRLPGAPSGVYLRLVFKVAIDDGAATETVVLVQTDSGWRVAMYGVVGAG